MKTESGKVAASRTMPASNSVTVKSYADGEDPRVKAMWDEEFFGHELPPNFKISRVGTPIEPEKRKVPHDGRCDLMGEWAMWDEEFLGHDLPPNYVISRFRTPDVVEKKKGSGGRPEVKDSGGHLSRSSRRLRFNAEDTFEYNFDKTVDSYVLSEEISGACKDTWGMAKPVLTTKDEFGKVETFEERALRFGVEDWNLVGNKKWPQNECKGGSKRSTRRGIFHSPSGSDTSSMISTLESSSFSCGSEGSSFAKTDFSSSSFNLSHVYAMSGGAIPLSAVGRQPSGLSVERSIGEEQFVELNISDREKVEDESVSAPGTEVKDGSSYFEFNFLDGKMVESDDVDDKEGRGGDVQMKMDDIIGSPELELLGTAPSPSEYQPGPAQSPESENFFDSSHDSDWSGTHSASTIDQSVACARDAEVVNFDDDSASNFTEYRACEDWSGVAHFYDGDPSVTPLNPPSSSGSKDHFNFHSDAEGKLTREVNSHLHADGTHPTAKPSTEERSTGRSPKKLQQGSSRKTRSLGSVLSHHLAFTAVPSLRYKSQPPLTAEQKESPAKVSAACIEWLWSEKDAMKPVQALRALADRENAERERIGSSPPVRNLDSAFRESRTFGLGRSQPALNGRVPTVDTSKMMESPASGVQKDHAKESRDSILASWAAVYGTGDSTARARRPSAASKISPAAPSARHIPRGAMSPRRRSVSFSAQAGSRSASSLTKQPVPKSLALELEVLCRPFGPVLKGVRFLPTAKRGLGRPPLFSNLGPQLASGSSSSSITLPAVLKCGRLQCVVSRDGLPSYSLIMDETEEIFAAKTLRVDAGVQEGVSHVYTFHSFKGKGKGKSGWRQWGKKEKPGSDFAGNMTVTSTICPVVTSNGVQNFVESEFVLFDAKVKEISISGPTSTSPYPRSSFSSWDTVTPQRSPPGPSSTYSSPSSTYFSLPSPSGAFSTPASAAGLTTPTGSSRSVSLTLPGGLPSRGSANLDKGVSRFKQLERHLSLMSPLHSSLKSNFGFHEAMSDSETADDFESRTWGLRQSQSELAAVVVRTPLEKSQGKTASVGDKWGWGINFLRKSFDGSTKGGSSPDQGVATGDSPGLKDGAREKTPTTCQVSGSASAENCHNFADQRCAACGSTSGDEHIHGGLNITLILPSGEHGCSTNGIDGPQPLIERWRSGGKCDCGSWDLGCGLTIVGNQRFENVDALSGRGQSRDSTLRLYVEGKKQQTVGLALTPLKEGCYSLGFQAPISPLHAFATAVAVLHSRDPIMAAKKAGETKKRLTRIPVKVVPASSRSFSRVTDDPSGSRSLVSYKLVCPDPPSSPFGRA